jgi:nicotinamide riboside kinase
MKPIKIVVIGPESSGKSTLAESLAKHHGTIFIPEVARSFLTYNGNEYTQSDLMKISKMQTECEFEKAQDWMTKWNNANKRPFLFLDTDLQVIRLWSEWVYGYCDSFILHQLAAVDHDGYILCEPDLPWENDPLRSNPDIRDRWHIYHHYREMLIETGKPWTSINGLGQARLDQANLFLSKM